MATRWWWFPAVLALALLASLACWPEAGAQPGVTVPGRYQIATFPGRAAQFGLEQNATGCYLLDTATGQLRTLVLDGEGRGSWKEVCGPVR
ncbi:hypothetical protein OJF2_43520 [Aquisphaera giovannonii]|uniref:Uncharacterized protein n=1 Tax=Aquisphaera giovannonii TaxID=406548 RepID=A0A5B9W6V0_9BACT|nr:hypothetical protein [Aquisphaera giovannonii]QEH35795.1 hypothetical protein OJF2_43520 [Aquisphaera giovannonii]